MPLEFLVCNYSSAGPALKVLYICAGFLDTKLLEKSNFEGGPTIKNTSAMQDLCNIMVTCISFHVFSFVCRLQGFQAQIFEAENKCAKSFGNLVEISTEFLINIDFKTTETRFTTFHSLLFTFE